MITNIPAALVLAFLPQVPVDSAAALHQARRLVREHHDTITIRPRDERERLSDGVITDWC